MKVRRTLTGFLQELPIGIDDETTQRVWIKTADLAEQHRLTAHDAPYLELSLRLGLPLATRDRPLIAAARSAGVALLPAA